MEFMLKLHDDRSIITESIIRRRGRSRMLADEAESGRYTSVILDANNLVAR